MILAESLTILCGVYGNIFIRWKTFVYLKWFHCIEKSPFVRKSFLCPTFKIQLFRWFIEFITIVFCSFINQEVFPRSKLSILFLIFDSRTGQNFILKKSWKNVLYILHIVLYVTPMDVPNQHSQDVSA